MTEGELQFREFFAAEYGRLRGLGYLLTSDWAEAEELAQDALVRTYHAWGGSPPRPARRICPQGAGQPARSLLRRAMVEARHLAGRRAEEAYEAELGTDGLVLWSAVRRLPACQRAVLVLRYHEDPPEAEVARLLRLPSGTVKSLAHRGLARLRGELGSPAMEDIGEAAMIEDRLRETFDWVAAGGPEEAGASTGSSATAAPAALAAWPAPPR